MTSPHSILVVATAWALVACTPPPPDPGASPEGKLCGRAYGSTIDSLEDMFTQAGKDLPEVLDKKAYVKLCVEMDFTEAQLKCMDPKLAQVDPGCAETLEGVKDKTSKLAAALLPKQDADKMQADPAGEADE